MLRNDDYVREAVQPIVQKKTPNNENIKNTNFKTNKNPVTFEPNEIVSYQVVWKNFIKWVPAKIVKKISTSIYLIIVNGANKTAHLRQLRKSKTNNLNNWPGTFVAYHNENYEIDSESDCNNSFNDFEEQIDDNIEPGTRNENNKRLRQLEYSRPERLRKFPKRNYKE